MTDMYVCLSVINVYHCIHVCDNYVTRTINKGDSVDRFQMVLAKALKGQCFVMTNQTYMWFNGTCIKMEGKMTWKVIHTQPSYT